jgi:hypothetical protein
MHRVSYLRVDWFPYGVMAGFHSSTHGADVAQLVVLILFYGRAATANLLLLCRPGLEELLLYIQ